VRPGHISTLHIWLARHPQATPAELHRLLADLWLGPELAARVYGPLPSNPVVNASWCGE